MRLAFFFPCFFTWPLLVLIVVLILFMLHLNNGILPYRSYTDRILWKSAHGMTGNVVPFIYEPCEDFITSDHKPIRGAYLVKANKPRISVPPPPPAADLPRSNSFINARQIHLLVSNLRCANLPIMDPDLLGGLSDPYILFASYPKPLMWRKAWPSTTVVKRNLNPLWEEDMHLTLDMGACTDGEGVVSLSECMLYMTVMDEDLTSGDDVIGTVALSFAALCAELNLTETAQSSIQKTDISTPILRDGLEFGTLECTISTAYLSRKETKAFLESSKKVRSKTRKLSRTNAISAFLGF